MMNLIDSIVKRIRGTGTYSYEEEDIKLEADIQYYNNVPHGFLRYSEDQQINLVLQVGSSHRISQNKLRYSNMTLEEFSERLKKEMARELHSYFYGDTIQELQSIKKDMYELMCQVKAHLPLANLNDCLRKERALDHSEMIYNDVQKLINKLSGEEICTQQN